MGAMTGFDFIVLFIVAVAAIGGFLRGLVQEVLSLAAWILAAFSVYYLHDDLTRFLLGLYDVEPGAAVLAFALLLLIPYAAMKLIAGNVGEASRGSILGPMGEIIDQGKARKLGRKRQQLRRVELGGFRARDLRHHGWGMSVVSSPSGAISARRSAIISTSWREKASAAG
jgi:hypothetical protein